MAKAFKLPWTNIAGKLIPRALLGTSPMIAAGQFGYRSLEYYMKFVVRAKGVVELFEHAFGREVTGVQLLPYPHVVRGLLEASKRTGVSPVIVLTVLPEQGVDEVAELVEALDVRLLLLHAAVADTRRPGLVGERLDELRELGLPVGVATHSPVKTIRFFMEERLRVDAVMAPLNPRGLFMGDREEALRLYEAYGKPIIAKKVLGAGRIPPREAIPYAYSQGYVASIAVGVASPRELDETFNVIARTLGEPP